MLRTPGSQHPLVTASVPDISDTQRLREGKQVAEVTQHLHEGAALLASLPRELQTQGSPRRDPPDLDGETRQCSWGTAEAPRSQAGLSGESPVELAFSEGAADGADNSN